MDKQTNAGSDRKRRTSGLVLNPVQVGLAVGFIAVALLIVFGVGVIIGMWYQASGHMSTYADAMPAAGERAVAAGDSGHHVPDVTFYSTLTESESVPVPLPPSPAASREAQEAPGSSTLLPPEPAMGDTQPPAQAPPHTAALPSAPPAGPRYSVQVGSFRAAEQAETLRQHLARKGYDVRVRLSMVPGQGAWYRVRVGQFATRVAAEGAAQRLHSQERIPVMVAVE
jgi:cell division protein FtsN